ncbi:hypothetical protein GDO81_002263 [Engystomops pustulosus]|uniref:Secreted protein n=1 Tax=Engystomops pustulosus TaxID=76066 RepID=A0AAV7DK33_ENGPU|nr:hypothetical protein GDO81_002263 [Engystomops pustulosus]
MFCLSSCSPLTVQWLYYATTDNHSEIQHHMRHHAGVKGYLFGLLITAPQGPCVQEAKHRVYLVCKLHAYCYRALCWALFQPLKLKTYILDGFIKHQLLSLINPTTCH